MPSSRAALTFVLLSVFIDSLGFGIIIPSLPSVIMQLTGEPVSTAADWSGYLMAVYALLQFFMAPIFGNLSDRFGRRPLLLLSLFAFGVDFLLTGLAKSMAWLFVGRAFAGVFGASFSTAGAYIGDISNDDNRAKNFGFIGAAWGSRFHFGAGDRRLRRRSDSIRARRFLSPRRWRWPTSRSDSSRCRNRCRSNGAASSSGCARIRSAR